MTRLAVRNRLGRVAVLATLAVGIGSCHKMPLLAPSGSTISLVLSGSDVIAIVLEGEQQTGSGTGSGGATTPGVGNPVNNGTVITFTTTLGKIEPVQALTTGGRANAKFDSGGNSGTATITAFSGAAKASVDVKIGAAAAARLLLTASPQALPPTGGTSTINARLEDQSGNGISNVLVSFSTDVGSLSSTSFRTDANGVAVTQLTTIQGPATVTASAGGGGTTTLTGTVKVTLKPRSSATVTVPTGTITESVPATFTVNLVAGSIVTDVILDMGDGTSTHLGAITGTTPFQYIYANDGAFTVTVTAIDFDGVQTTNSAGIFVVPLTISLSSSSATGTTGTPITFTSTLGATGVAVDHYVWDFGDGSPTVITGSGTQSHAYALPGTKTVTVTVVPTKGHSKSASVTVQIS